MDPNLSMSDAFYKKLAEIVEANLENEHFGSEDLVREAGMSRSQVHRKLQKATGKSATRFIREIRLQRAHEMLVDGVGTASEISYKVGFSSPTYFSKCFTDLFGYTPGEARNHVLQEENKSINHTFGSGNPIRLLGIMVIILAFGWAFYVYLWPIDTEQANTPTKNAIAVLYFDNISGDDSQEFLSDGVTDEIITQLSKIGGLRVPGLSSVKPFKESSTPLSKIADQLNVAFVLEGTVKRSGDKLRITTRLVDVLSGNTLWTEIYERNYVTEEIFDIQFDIARAVASKFIPATSLSADAFRPPTTSIDAYELFLRATSHVTPIAGGSNVPRNRLAQAEKLLKKVIQIDPGFGEAYLELAKIYDHQYLVSQQGESKGDSIHILLRQAIANDPTLVDAYIQLAISINNQALSYGFNRFFINREEIGFGKMRDSIWYLLKKAYRIDPTIGLTGIGDLLAGEGNFPGAIQCYNEVLRINPWQIQALLNKALIYGIMDEPDSSLKYLSFANKIAPNNPEIALYEIQNLSLMIHKYMKSGNYEAFYKILSDYFEDDQKTIDYRMGICYLFAKKYQQAEPYYLESGYRDMDVGLLLLKTGRADSGRKVLKNALKYRQALGVRVFEFDLARIYAALGQTRGAVESFVKSIQSGFSDIAWIRVDPFIDYIRDDPEFKGSFQKLLENNENMFEQMKAQQDEPFDLERIIP